MIDGELMEVCHIYLLTTVFRYFSSLMYTSIMHSKYLLNRKQSEHHHVIISNIMLSDKVITNVGRIGVHTEGKTS
jgi:hypothetical protein